MNMYDRKNKQNDQSWGTYTPKSSEGFFKESGKVLLAGAVLAGALTLGYAPKIISNEYKAHQEYQMLKDLHKDDLKTLDEKTNTSKSIDDKIKN